VTGDIDGDGRILTMHIADPNGSWKVCLEEPRLLVRRDPTETGSDYYRLLPEGRSGKPSSPSGWAGQAADVTDDRPRVEWLVSSEAGMTLRLSAKHDRAGTVKVAVTL
jgi:hypothetical protein